MAVIENEVVIRRQPAEVFDVLSDLRSELQWNPDVQSMEKITEGPIGIGTKFRAKWKQSGYIVCECTAFDRPSHWAYHNGGLVEVDLNITVAPTPEGCRLVSRFDAHPHGWFTLVFPVFMMIMRRAEKRTLKHAKAFLESAEARLEASHLRKD